MITEPDDNTKAEFASDEALRLALPQPGRYAALSITDTGVTDGERTGRASS